MPVIEVTSTAVLLIESDPKRKFISFTNEDIGNKVYISDKGKPTYTDAKWIINPLKTLIISREIGYPGRAFYALSAGGDAKLAVGFQNDDDEGKQ